MLNVINRLADEVESPTKLVIGRKLYNFLRKDLLPTPRQNDGSSTSQDIRRIGTNNGMLDVEVVEEDIFRIV